MKGINLRIVCLNGKSVPDIVNHFSVKTNNKGKKKTRCTQTLIHLLLKERCKRMLCKITKDKTFCIKDGRKVHYLEMLSTETLRSAIYDELNA